VIRKKARGRRYELWRPFEDLKSYFPVEPYTILVFNFETGTIPFSADLKMLSKLEISDESVPVDLLGT
jgi:hypothetical protein